MSIAALAFACSTLTTGLDGDPFARSPFGLARPDALQTYGDDVAFVKNVLAGDRIGRSIRYRVMGTDTWLTSDVWPPSGIRSQEFGLAPSALAAAPVVEEAELEYRVDPTTWSGGAGPHSRGVRPPARAQRELGGTGRAARPRGASIRYWTAPRA